MMLEDQIEGSPHYTINMEEHNSTAPSSRANGITNSHQDLSSTSQGDNSLDALFNQGTPQLHEGTWDLLKDVFDYLILEAATLGDKMNPDDLQLLANFLDPALGEEILSATDRQNRILTLLSRIATYTRIYPQRYITRPIEFDVEPEFEGVFGDVHRALAGTVCVKVMRRTSDDALKSFVKELILWSRLSHTNVLPFFGIYHSLPSQKMCLVSPWMKKGNLSEYSANLSQKDRMPLLFDVVNGLAYLHALGIVHSDIQGSNILVSDEGRALIAGFGMSHIATNTMEQGTTKSTVSHSAHFAPPEVLETYFESSTARPTKAGDIWSLGCLFYEVLTRKIPFHGLTIFRIFRIVLYEQGHPKRPNIASNGSEEVDDTMWALMTTCWVFDSSARPNCQDIQKRFMDLGTTDGRPTAQLVEKPEALKAESKQDIDFARVGQILRGLQLVELNPSEASERIHDNGTAPDVIIIAFIGAAGAGKSTFVDLLVGHQDMRPRKDPESADREVEGICIKHPKNEQRIVLVDTPGFNDTGLTEGTVLKQVADWLGKTYDTNTKLAGIVYLRPITDDRASSKQSDTFDRLCGENAMQRVILATTMWKDVDLEAGQGRESQLIEKTWKSMISKGAMVDRLEATDHEVAWRIIDRLIDKHKTSAVYTQQSSKQNIKRTGSGKAVQQALKDTLTDLQRQLKRLQDQKNATNDPRNKKHIIKRIAEIEDEHKNVINRVQDIGELPGDLLLNVRQQVKQITRKTKTSFQKSTASPLPNTIDNNSYLKVEDAGSTTEKTRRLSRMEDDIEKVEITDEIGESGKSGELGVTKSQRIDDETRSLKPNHRRGSTRSESPYRSNLDSTTEAPRIPTILELARATTKDVLDHLTTEAEQLATKIGHDDVQLLTNYLDSVLDHERATALDRRNRILTLLSRIAVHTRIYPQRYVLQYIDYNTESVTEGGFADVYQARDKTLCVKVMRRIGDDVLKSYIKELILWSRLSHPNILPFFGIFHSRPAEKMCLVSPWMKNGNLSDHTVKFKLSREDRMLLISDVADGLAYLHDLGIVHSDIKGQNVLVSNEGRALITDFGSSHIATHTMKQGITHSGISHSPNFTSPELLKQCFESTTIRPKKACDVWSFGCLSFETLTGKMPFHGQTVFSIYRTVYTKRSHPSRPKPGEDGYETIDNRVWALMVACWAFKPAARPDCRDIQQRIAKLKIADDRPSAKPAEKPAGIETESKIDLNLVRVEQILDGFHKKNTNALQEIGKSAVGNVWYRIAQFAGKALLRRKNRRETR